MLIKKDDGTKVQVATTNGLSTMTVSNEDAVKQARIVSKFFKEAKEKFESLKKDQKQIHQSAKTAKA